jgi:ATP-independent RNA helicase DbpA
MDDAALASRTSFWGLAHMGFSAPTPIQVEAMPLLDEGKSIFALAPTGSGKTLAFLWPLMQKIDSFSAATQLLILAPTRELGTQIAQVAEKVAKILGEAGEKLENVEKAEKSQKGITVRKAFGGQKIEAQRQEMGRNPHVVVATPGRALDLLRREQMKINALRAFVLDEADLMLGMGFEEQIADVCDFLPGKIQTALFSATEASLQTRLQNRLAHRAVRVDVRGDVVQSSHASRLGKVEARHEFILVENHASKNKALAEFLRENDSIIQSGVVFCQTRAGATEVCERMRKNGFAAEELSGGLGQVERSTIMRRFKAKGVKYLIATNIAARGIDVSELSIVINYDLPSTPDEYTHRSGRSGRAGHVGWTLSLCLRNAQDFYFDIMQKNSIRARPFAQNVQQGAAEVDLASANVATSEEVLAPQFSKIYINKGKSSKIRPGDIVGTLVKQMGLSPHDVGNIFIFDHFTHVEVNESLSTKIIEELPSFKIKGLAVKVSEAKELVAARSRGRKA